MKETDGIMVQTFKMFYMSIPMKNAAKYVSILSFVRPHRKFFAGLKAHKYGFYSRYSLGASACYLINNDSERMMGSAPRWITTKKDGTRFTVG